MYCMLFCVFLYLFHRSQASRREPTFSLKQLVGCMCILGDDEKRIMCTKRKQHFLTRAIIRIAIVSRKFIQNHFFLHSLQFNVVFRL